MPNPDTLPEDGRRRRSQTSRDKIVAAMLELIAEGRITPSADEVASRARVGLRTVFRHFADMESLYAALTRALADQYEMWMVPFASSVWREQLVEVVERRTATYERLLPFKRASDVHRHMSPTMQSHYASVLGIMRQRLHALLPSSIADDVQRFETIDLLLSFEVWQRFRGEQELCAERSRDIILHEILRLADAGT